ncbi:hypothetical protein ACFS4T_17410 [Pseudomonas lini]
MSDEKKDERNFSLWEIDAFDGSSARALAKYSNGAIRTLTNSPNKANQQHFDAHADKEISAFYSGSFLQITEDIVADSLGVDSPFFSGSTTSMRWRPFSSMAETGMST